MKADKNGKLPDRYCYPAVITYTDSQVKISFCDIECEVEAKNQKDALKLARTALGRELFVLEEAHQKLPEPTPMTDVSLESSQCTTLVDVYMPAIRLSEINRSVSRMVSLPAWLNAAALERNINFSQVLQEALKKEIFHDYAE